MTGETLQGERTFQRAAATSLQTQQGYYPAEVVLPELDRKLGEFEVRLVRIDSYGTPYVVVMSVLDAAQREEFIEGGLRKRYLDAVAEAMETSGADRSIRVAVVLIAEDPLGSRTARHRLRRVRLGRRPLREVAFYWVSPVQKTFQSGYRFLSFAPNSALNPCNPEPNLFTKLLRSGWDHVGPTPAGDRQVKAYLAERSFSEKLLTRPTVVWVFLAANLLVWYATERLGGSRNIDVLIRCGAKVDGLIRLGQYWRLLTATFLHAGYAHMFINGLALLVLGQTLERLYGSVRFVLAYVGCGVLAALASMMMGHGVMVGASGAIFGIVGMLVAYGFRYRHDIPGRYQAMFGAGLLPLVGLNVLLGLIIPQIDNAAHIGGLLAGCVLGLVFRPRTAPRASAFASLVRRMAFVCAVAAVLVSGFTAWSFFRTYPNIAKVDERFALEHRFGPVEMVVPATWTIRREEPARWRLASSYCQAEIEVMETTRPLLTAVRRCEEHLMRERDAPKVPMAMIEGALAGLEQDGRADFGLVVRGRQVGPHLTFVVVPGELAELAMTATNPWGEPRGELAAILTRMEESFVPEGRPTVKW